MISLSSFLFGLAAGVYLLAVIIVISETDQGEGQTGLEYLAICAVTPFVVTVIGIYSGYKWLVTPKEI